jgi:hypothetical protein
VNTIAQQIRELQDLPVAQLATRYAALFGKPPRVRNAAFLRRQVAWRLQEQQLGGLSERARARLDELVAQIDLPIPTASPPRQRAVTRTAAGAEPKGPMVGTTLVRKWRGQELRVEVRENGFEWNGALYSSLSAVAKAITGAAWNGRLFFGLVQRRAGA